SQLNIYFRSTVNRYFLLLVADIGKYQRILQRWDRYFIVATSAGGSPGRGPFQQDIDARQRLLGLCVNDGSGNRFLPVLPHRRKNPYSKQYSHYHEFAHPPV